jgi:hypothetical protein
MGFFLNVYFSCNTLAESPPRMSKNQKERGNSVAGRGNHFGTN